jgi:group I intron endonuclease
MSKIGGIYKWENTITKTVYIGQTNDFLRRRREEKYLLQKGRFSNSHFQASWKKHGADKFTFSILEEIENHMFLTSFEQAYLDYYKSLNAGVYNQGGPVDSPTRGVPSSKKGKPGRKLTEKEREDISLRFMGHQVSDEVKNKIASKARGRRHSDDTKNKIRSITRQMWQDEGIKNKLLALRASPEWRKKISNTRIKTRFIEAIDLNTGLVLEFTSLHNAAQAGFDKSAILRVLNGKSASHKGCFWQELAKTGEV